MCKGLRIILLLNLSVFLGCSEQAIVPSQLSKIESQSSQNNKIITIKALGADDVIEINLIINDKSDDPIPMNRIEDTNVWELNNVSVLTGLSYTFQAFAKIGTNTYPSNIHTQTFSGKESEFDVKLTIKVDDIGNIILEDAVNITNISPDSMVPNLRINNLNIDFTSENFDVTATAKISNGGCFFIVDSKLLSEISIRIENANSKIKFPFKVEQTTTCKFEVTLTDSKENNVYATVVQPFIDDSIAISTQVDVQARINLPPDVTVEKSVTTYLDFMRVKLNYLWNDDDGIDSEKSKFECSPVLGLNENFPIMPDIPETETIPYIARKNYIDIYFDKIPESPFDSTAINYSFKEQSTLSFNCSLHAEDKVGSFISRSFIVSVIENQIEQEDAFVVSGLFAKYQHPYLASDDYEIMFLKGINLYFDYVDGSEPLKIQSLEFNPIPLGNTVRFNEIVKRPNYFELYKNHFGIRFDRELLAFYLYERLKHPNSRLYLQFGNSEQPTVDFASDLTVSIDPILGNPTFYILQETNGEIVPALITELKDQLWIAEYPCRAYRTCSYPHRKM